MPEGQKSQSILKFDEALLVLKNAINNNSSLELKSAAPAFLEVLESLLRGSDFSERLYVLDTLLTDVVKNDEFSTFSHFAMRNPMGPKSFGVGPQINLSQAVVLLIFTQGNDLVKGVFREEKLSIINQVFRDGEEMDIMYIKSHKEIETKIREIQDKIKIVCELYSGPLNLPHVSPKDLMSLDVMQLPQEITGILDTIDHEKAIAQEPQAQIAQPSEGNVVGSNSGSENTGIVEEDSKPHSLPPISLASALVIFQKIERERGINSEDITQLKEFVENSASNGFHNDSPVINKIKDWLLILNKNSSVGELVSDDIEVEVPGGEPVEEPGKETGEKEGEGEGQEPYVDLIAHVNQLSVGIMEVMDAISTAAGFIFEEAHKNVGEMMGLNDEEKEEEEEEEAEEKEEAEEEEVENLEGNDEEDRISGTAKKDLSQEINGELLKGVNDIIDGCKKLLSANLDEILNKYDSWASTDISNNDGKKNKIIGELQGKLINFSDGIHGKIRRFRSERLSTEEQEVRTKKAKAYIQMLESFPSGCFAHITSTETGGRNAIMQEITRQVNPKIKKIQTQQIDKLQGQLDKLQGQLEMHNNLTPNENESNQQTELQSILLSLQEKLRSFSQETDSIDDIYALSQRSHLLDQAEKTFEKYEMARVEFFGTEFFGDGGEEEEEEEEEEEKDKLIRECFEEKSIQAFQLISDEFSIYEKIKEVRQNLHADVHAHHLHSVVESLKHSSIAHEEKMSILNKMRTEILANKKQADAQHRILQDASVKINKMGNGDSEEVEEGVRE